MQYSTATVLALLASMAQAVKLTNSAFSGIEEGKSFTITWADAVGPVSLTLKSGDPKNLQTVTTITTSGSGGSFTWTPPTLPSGTYAIEIKDTTNVPNYSNQFEFKGTGTASSSAASSASSTASSTAASSTTTSASATTTSAPSSSSTTARPSSSTSSGSNSTTSTSSSARPSGTAPTNTNDSSKMYGSSLALIVVGVAALFLN